MDFSWSRSVPARCSGIFLGGWPTSTASDAPASSLRLPSSAASPSGCSATAQTSTQALLLAIVGGAGNGFVTLSITTLVQVTTPSEIRGRVLGLLATLSSALTPIAMGLAGIVADMLDQNIGAIYLACGAITLVVSLRVSTSRAYRGILATDFAPAVDPARHSRSTAGRGAQNVESSRDANERTRDVYEHISTYIKPALPPLIKEEDLDELLSAQGQPKGSRARRLTDAVFALTGVRPFLRRLPDEIESLLRHENFRLPGLYAPVISATLALDDDPRTADPFVRACYLDLRCLQPQGRRVRRHAAGRHIPR